MTSKYELPLSTSYVEHWGINEALREFFQNAIDQGNYDYEYDNQINELTIVNHDSFLDRSTLLLGESSKRDNKSNIGSYGEGYKIATLVLLREGYEVKIENNAKNELWNTCLVKSRKFKKTIPVFNISTNKSDNNDLIVKITGITQDEFDEYKKLNLNLQSDEEIGVVLS